MTLRHSLKCRVQIRVGNIARYLFSVLGVFIIIYQRKGMFSNSRFNVFLMTGRFVDVTVDLLHGINFYGYFFQFDQIAAFRG